METASRTRVRYDLARRGVAARAAEDILAWLDDASEPPPLEQLLLEPAPTGGSEALRAQIAACCDSGIRPEHVVVTAGRRAAVSLLADCLGAHAQRLVLDTPLDRRVAAVWSASAQQTAVARSEAEGWRLDPERFEAALGPGAVGWLQTPHDPTGALLDDDALCRLAAAAERTGAWLVVDETEGDLREGALAPVAAGLSPRVITLGSAACSHGLPGLRLAWLVVRDPALRARLLAAGADGRCSISPLDEAVVQRALLARAAWREQQAVRLRLTRETLVRWAAGQSEIVRLVPPRAGTVALASAPPLAGSARADDLYRRLEEQHGVAVCPGPRFGLPPHAFRIGFGAPSHDDLVMGLAHVSEAVRGCAG